MKELRFSEEKVLAMLEADIAHYFNGSALQCAKAAGISQQYLGDIRKRRRNLSQAVLDMMGLEKVVEYRMKVQP